jgi:hypothetical protein
MGNDLIKMGDLYVKNVLSETFNSPVNDNQHSYNTSLVQPGNAEPQPGMSQVSTNSSQVNFPSEIPNEEKINLLKKFLKDEIDNGKWDEKHINAFKNFLGFIL